MRTLIASIYKVFRKLRVMISNFLSLYRTRFLFYCNKIDTGSVSSKGVPYVMVARGGKCSVGQDLRLNNSISSNPIGRVQRCSLVVGPGASLVIGDHVGMSFVAINCQHNITIGNHVMIGGGTCIYDTDFHPLSVSERNANENGATQKAAVVIGNNVFIGANSTVLKGVQIGDGAVIGACSVVTKSIPSGEIWAGNPARFIKKME